MKKIALLFALLAMVISMAACGAEPAPAASDPDSETAASPSAPADSKEEAPEEDGGKPYDGAVVTFWHYPYTGEDQSYWDARAAVFKERTGITVETTIIPWGADGAAKLSASLLGGVGPDVLYVTAETAYDLIAAGHLLDLSTVLPREVLDDEIYLEKTKTGDKQYMLPYSGGVSYRGVAFNLDLLRAAGVEKAPATRGELVDAARKVQAAGVCEYPVMMPMATAAETPMSAILPNIWSGGGDYVTADGEVIFDSPENLETLQWMYDLVYTHKVLSTDCTGIDAAALRELFIEGKAAMVFGEVHDYLDRAAEIDFDWTTSLGIAAEGKEVMTFCPLDMVSVNANAKNQGAALEWLKFLISVEQRNDFRENCYPTLLQLNKSADPITYPVDCINADMAAAAEHTRALPIVKGGSTMTTEMCTNVQLMMMGELTPEEAVDAIQAACEAAAG